MAGHCSSTCLPFQAHRGDCATFIPQSLVQDLVQSPVQSLVQGGSWQTYAMTSVLIRRRQRDIWNRRGRRGCDDRIWESKGEVTQSHKPRNENSLQKLGKSTKWSWLRASRGNTALVMPCFGITETHFRRLASSIIAKEQMCAILSYQGWVHLLQQQWEANTMC